MKLSLEDRFEAKVNRLGDCHMWMAGTDKDGYGTFTKDGKDRKAHRVAWELHYEKEVPRNLCVCHTCDTPGCVNPEHLWVGTPADNALDKAAKGRASRQIGEENPRARLADEDVRAIRADARTQTEIGNEYGISQTMVSQIKRRSAWRHIK